VYDREGHQALSEGQYHSMSCIIVSSPGIFMFFTESKKLYPQGIRDLIGASQVALATIVLLYQTRIL
jgi:hypothetical protein